jgi:uncharacterized membrane protein YuzA (DUF378 family)
MKTVHIIAFILLIIGGLNWLLTAFNWNIVSNIFGPGSTIANAIYILIGLAAIWEAVMHGKNCKMCSAKM